MALEVESRDCASVSDAELQELADLCAEGPNPFSVGFLSKQTELWVLLTEARAPGKLRGFAFSTLERIGGTPVVITGAAAVARISRRPSILQALVAEQMHRAVMAFPDEDVVMGIRLNSPSGFDIYKLMSDIIPRPGHEANGEERAQGRRLARRYQIPSSAYEARSFIARGNGTQAAVLDYQSNNPQKLKPELIGLFDDVRTDQGDSLVTFAWAPAGLLAKYRDLPG